MWLTVWANLLYHKISTECLQDVWHIIVNTRQQLITALFIALYLLPQHYLTYQRLGMYQWFVLLHPIILLRIRKYSSIGRCQDFHVSIVLFKLFPVTVLLLRHVSSGCKGSISNCFIFSGAEKLCCSLFEILFLILQEQVLDCDPRTIEIGPLLRRIEIWHSTHNIFNSRKPFVLNLVIEQLLASHEADTTEI